MTLALASLITDEATGGRSTLRERLKRYAKGVRSAEMIGAQVSQFDGRRAEKLNHCARTLFFHDHGPAGAKLVGGYYCQQWKLCRVCSMRRAVRTLGVLVPKAMQRMQESPLRRAFMVTITTLDGDDCKERFDHLQDCTRRYMQQARSARKDVRREGVEANKAIGIYSATEATRGKNSGQWHWHTHQVWITDGDRPSWTALKAEWFAVTGDSMVVHIKELKSSAKRRRDPTHPIDEAAMAKDLVEVCKYPLKPQQLQALDAWTLHTATHGRHFTRTYGELRFTAAESAALEEQYADDQVVAGEFVAKVFRWWRPGSMYVELKGMAAQAFDRPLRQLGALAVNRGCVRRYLAGGLGGASPLLDTGVKIGTHDPGGGASAYRPPPGVRLEAPPVESENAFG